METFFDFHLKTYGKSFLFECNYHKNDIVVNNPFIRDVCSAWSTYTHYKPESNFGDEIIWNNSYIKINKKIILYKAMKQKGIMFVKDLFNTSNRPIPINAFKDRYSLDVLPFTILFGIITAIPNEWKSRLGETTLDAPDHPIQSLHTIPFLSRFIYTKLITSQAVIPTATRKWNLIFTITDRQWKTIFQAPFYSVRDSKVQYLQFRFIHRILGTNHLLYNMNITDNPRCSFCGRHDETLLHIFWECSVTSNFILDVEQAIFGYQFIFSKRDICFGYNCSMNHPYNFLIFHLKNFIYSHKIANITLKCNEFIYKFKFLLQVEKELIPKTGKSYCTYNRMKEAFSACNVLFT